MKIINNETITHFKKFISKLYKKEEDTILNKKKKREEIKQKNKFEKTRINRNGVNQYNYYQSLYMPPMSTMQPINNQNPAFFNDYQNLYYYNPSYQLSPHMIGIPPYFQQYMVEPPKNLQESLHNIYSKGMVNNIIGAFYIKECQEKLKNNEKRKVPVSMVELGDEQGNNNTTSNNNITSNINGNLNYNNGENSNNSINNRNDSGQIKLPYLINEQMTKPIMAENNIENNENKGDNMSSEKKEIKSNEKEEKGHDSEKKEKESNSKSNNTHKENGLKKPDVIF